MDSIETVCEVCHGTRYSEEVLKYQYKEKNIAEVMDMTVCQAIKFFENANFVRKLDTLVQVMGCGIQKGSGERYRGAEVDATLLPKVKVEVVIGNLPVDTVVEAAREALYTGHIGDGKIFVYSVDKIIKIRTGEEDLAALKDVE